VSTRDLITFWLCAAGYLLVCAASWALIVLAVLWVLP